MKIVAKILNFNYKYVFKEIWPFWGFFQKQKQKKWTCVWLFFDLRSLVWNNDNLCDDPKLFSDNIFFKKRYSRVVLFIFVNFDVFTNKTFEWPKLALFYRSFWQVLDCELAAGLTLVTTFLHHFFGLPLYRGLKIKKNYLGDRC